MRRLLYLLTMSIMITGLLFFGTTSAFASLENLSPEELERLLQLQQRGDDDGGLLGEEDGILEAILCALLGDDGLLGGEDDVDTLGGLGLDGDEIDLLILDLDCDDDVVVVDTPPADGVTPVTPVGTVGDVGGQVGQVPVGGVQTGGGTTPVGATALIGTLLAIAAVGAGLGRALARSRS